MLKLVFIGCNNGERLVKDLIFKPEIDSISCDHNVLKITLKSGTAYIYRFSQNIKAINLFNDILEEQDTCFEYAFEDAYRSDRIVKEIRKISTDPLTNL